VIEYILLFTLGFLAALLVVVLIAPAIKGRIVRFTENRIRATVPISTAELRAQADMVRASYAAENAKLSVTVRREREKGTASQLLADKLRAQLDGYMSENSTIFDRIHELEAELETRTGEIAEREKVINENEARLDALRGELEAAEKRISVLGVETEHLGGFIDSGKIDLAVRDTEIENLKASINMLKSERDQLREELKSAEERARSAEVKLDENHNKIGRLQDRLDREVAANAEQQEVIARHSAEIERLKETMAARPVEAPSMVQPEPVDEPAVAEPQDAEQINGAVNGHHAPSEPAEPEPEVIDPVLLADGIRADARDVSELLASPPSPELDDKLRGEIASIAARMVALTATKEGPTSPLLALADKRETITGRSRVSLASRAARALTGKDA
jgi:chromosome segregation ATPase